MSRVRVWLRQLFQVATVHDATGRHYHVTWAVGDAVGHRRWRWWDVRDWPPFRATPKDVKADTNAAHGDS